MNNDQLKNLALSLYKSESEEEVENILRSSKLWDDESLWHPIGNQESNYSIIGGQAASPVAALVEKIVNSMDAVLTSECLKQGVDPKSDKAPKTMVEAQEKYFGIHNGQLTNIGPDKRKEIAKNIFLIASGSKTLPCITIMDKGEGQEPSNFANTLVSLIQGVKKEIQFVQGKWGMGGSGALVFSSPKHRLQFVLSKKNHGIKNVNDTAWGFTVVRMFPPQGNIRMQIYKYLAPNKEILKFQADSLNILPVEDKDKISFSSYQSGTVFKLYEYSFNALRDAGRVRSYIGRHLNNQISTALPAVALPFSIVDLRHQKEGIRFFNSLNVRLDLDKRNLIEENFPTGGKLNSGKETLDFRIYLFKIDYSVKGSDQGRATFAENNEGVLFVNNGQKQGELPSRFFSSKKVGMDVLADSILIIIDTSNASILWQNEVYMNSRDRLRDSEYIKEIENQLADILSNNLLLKMHREKRARERAEHSFKESKSFANALEKILKQNEALSKILIGGNRLVNPFNTKEIGSVIEEYEGKQFPSFFKLKRNYPENNPRPTEIGRKIRIEFETDAVNDYFSRDSDAGEFNLFLNDQPTNYSHITLYNGNGFLNIEINSDYDIDKVYKLTAQIRDISNPNIFENLFWIKTIPYVKTEGSDSAKPRPRNPNPEDPENKKTVPDGLDLPKVEQITREKWAANKMDKHSALHVSYMGDEIGYEFLVNVDNDYLQNEIKINKKSDPNVIKSKYVMALVLIGLSMLRADEENKSKEDDQGTDIKDKISQFTSDISLVLLPIINELGNPDSQLIKDFASEYDKEDSIVE
jgi:hypothetical protein